MSPALADFYRSVQDWLDRGAPNDQPFQTDYGLCAALLCYCEQHGKGFHPLYREMREQFIAAGFSPTFPFNPTRQHYLTETNCYANPHRLAWIKEHAQ